MKTIFITISRGSLIRNFFRTGVIKNLLDNGVRVVVLSPNYSDKDVFLEFRHPNLFLEPLISPERIRFGSLMKEFLKGASFNTTIYALYRYRIVGLTPNKFFLIPRLLFFAPLRYVPEFKTIIRYIDFKLNPQKEHDYLFEKHHPDIVLSTTPHDGPDVGVLKSAKRFKVKTVSIPKSWDNLSKILFNVKTDYMLVWSPFMKDQAIKLQGYDENEVVVTGVPQFDYYANPENLISREEFCKRFSFDPQKKIILYASAGANCCNEIDYIRLIKRFIDDGKLKNTQVLVRPHVGYKNDVDRMREAGSFEGFYIYEGDNQTDKFRDNWDISESHLKNLFNSLYHADVCINAGSTITLDAMSCGTPVINLKFDINDNINFGSSIKRLYLSDYIWAIISADGTWLVNSEGEYLRALKEVLEDGVTEKPGTKNTISRFIYKIDGKSGKRISEFLIYNMNKI